MQRSHLRLARDARRSRQRAGVWRFANAWPRYRSLHILVDDIKPCYKRAVRRRRNPDSSAKGHVLWGQFLRACEILLVMSWVLLSWRADIDPAEIERVGGMR